MPHDRSARQITLKQTFPGQLDSLAAIGDLVTEAAHAADLDARDVYGIQLAVDEACSNIIQHAYNGERQGPIECICQVSDKGLSVTIRDRGEPFDPSSVPEPDLESDLEERDIGGLGVYFIHQMTDEVHFDCTAEGGNEVTLIKRRRKDA